jgi:hypothetical protein
MDGRKGTDGVAAADRVDLGSPERLIASLNLSDVTCFTLSRPVRKVRDASLDGATYPERREK